MRIVLPAWIVAAIVSSPVLAAGFEVTPFVGYRVGGDFDGIETASSELEESESYGLIVDLPVLKYDTQLELLFSHQETDLVASGAFGSPELLPIEIDFFQLGVIHEWDRRHVRPFFAATAGFAEFNPQGMELSSESRFALTLAGGAKIFFTEHMGLRLGLRLYATLFDGSGDVFCGDGGCLARASGSFLTQTELAAGLTIKY